MTRDEVEARALADLEATVGRHIKASSLWVSDGVSYTDEIDFPEPLTLRVCSDPYDIDRWMDAEHMDPLYVVDPVDVPAACQAILDEAQLHVLAVYGPSYTIDGGYDKPDWKVVTGAERTAICKHCTAPGGHPIWFDETVSAWRHVDSDAFGCGGWAPDGDDGTVAEPA